MCWTALTITVLCCCVLYVLQELYERLVEAERLRAEAEKQRGDDLSKIAMMLATGKGE